MPSSVTGSCEADLAAAQEALVNGSATETWLRKWAGIQQARAETAEAERDALAQALRVTVGTSEEVRTMTPKQLVEAIASGKWNGGISATGLRDAAKAALKPKAKRR